MPSVHDTEDMDATRNFPLTLSRVNALYGPGTVLGWYLTLLSIMVAWTMHPKRSRSDSLDADLFIMLTLPVVAAGHLIFQLRQDRSREASSLDAAVALEAPFIVTEAFMDLSVPLFLVAACTKSIKRAITIGVVGLTCYGLEWHIYLLRIQSHGLDQVFSRSFLADSITGMVFTAVTVGICMCGAIIFIAMYGIQSPADEQRQRYRIRAQSFEMLDVLDQGHDTRELSGLLDREMSESYADSKSMQAITMVSLVFLPMSAVSSFMAISPNLFEDLPNGQAMVQGLFHNFVKMVLPQSDSSFGDLDQVVAALGGATILSFNLISAARQRHLQELERKKRQAEIDRRNDIRLRRLLVQYGRERSGED